MKIHLIANMYPSRQHPSYGVFVKNTENILQAEGFVVDRTVLYKETNRLLKVLKYFFYFFRILWKGILYDYDVTYVHYAAHNALPLLLLKRIRRNLRIYTNVHGSDIVPEVASQEKFQPYVNKLLHVSDLVITPSNYYLELVRTKYNLNKPIAVFPSGGVDSKIFFEREDIKLILKGLNLDHQYNYLGYVSRLDVGKGWDILLLALKELKSEQLLAQYNLKVIMVGDGKDKQNFLHMVSEYNLDDEIIYYPLLPQKELNLIYNVIDVFCFPTTRKGESLGLVGLEAMACGTPVIGSKIGGLLDYIKDGKNGYLFEVGSANDLRAKLKEYYSLTEKQRNEMVFGAKSTAMEYEVENIKGKLINIFNHTTLGQKTLE